ncbi:MAG: hypothetical protein Q9162_005642 [Coniocarpon cinnabarinum]
MSLFSGGPAASSASSAVGDLSKDVEIKDVPDDSISSIRFSPTAELLAASSWNKQVRIWEISNDGQSNPRTLLSHEGPVLDCAWSKDGTKVFGAGTDKAVRMLDLGGGGQAQQVAAHDAPIKCIQFVDVNGQGVLVSGGWDKKIKYWDLRSSSPIATLDTQDRIYTMDSKDKLLVVGTAERWINVVNLNEPQKWYKNMQSPLKWQTRVVSCFADATGFAVGSIEGRCAIQYVEDKDSASNFSFKCHRITPPNQSNIANVYAVNSIRFHPVLGTFSTAGSDGTFHFWDKDAKHRLKGYPEVGQTITSTDFNRNGMVFAYAASYDWSRGFTGHQPNATNKIMLHPITGEECKPRRNPGKK